MTTLAWKKSRKSMLSWKWNVKTSVLNMHEHKCTKWHESELGQVSKTCATILCGTQMERVTGSVPPWGIDGKLAVYSSRVLHSSGKTACCWQSNVRPDFQRMHIGWLHVSRLSKNVELLPDTVTNLDRTFHSSLLWCNLGYVSILQWKRPEKSVGGGKSPAHR